MSCHSSNTLPHISQKGSVQILNIFFHNCPSKRRLLYLPFWSIFSEKKYIISIFYGAPKLFFCSPEHPLCNATEYLKKFKNHFFSIKNINFITFLHFAFFAKCKKKVKWKFFLWKSRKKSFAAVGFEQKNSYCSFFN